jgi:hypothetical protein
VVVLPTLLASCAAAAAFCFDEAPLAVVAVTPRGATWRRTARLAVAAVPLAIWTLVLVVRPGDLPLDRLSWWLVGFAVIGLSVGLAALASRRATASPGSSLAPAVVLVLLGPVVVGSFLDWESLYPIGDFGAGVRLFWAGVTAAGALAWLAALRPGLRT